MKTYFIGLGGCGLQTVASLSTRLKKDPNYNPDDYAFTYVDTDMFTYSRINSDSIVIPAADFVDMGPTVPLAIYNGAKNANDLNLAAGGRIIIKGAQGATGTQTIANFTAGFVLILITLIVVQNMIRSRQGRAIMAVRDNRIAAEAVGISITRYKMMAFVTSASLAGAAGALFGLNYSNLAAAKFDFNTSILVLVFVVLGGLGNIWGSIIATVVLYILPEALRGFANYRMLIYAVVLILVMLTTNNPIMKGYLASLREKLGKRSEKEANEA